MHDVYGLTPVYPAPASKNAHALRALLSLDLRVIAEDLEDRKHQEGITRGIGVLDAFDQSACGGIGGCVEGLLGIC